MKRVVLFRNGSSVDGKVFMLSHSLEELLVKASAKFEFEAKLLFTPQGGEIDCPQQIRDDDVLYVSTGEPFICPKSRDGEENSSQEWLLLNVGGKHFSTTRSTLVTKEPQSMLARMFALPEEEEIGQGQTSSNCRLSPGVKDHRGAYLIDRSPVYFEPLLNFLRHGQLILDKNINPLGVLEEAKFFGIDSVISGLESIALEEQVLTDHVPLSRREVVKAIMSTPHSEELRFQGINLSGADLSRLDLRNINFKYANLHGAKLTGCNMSHCCVERADLSQANLEGALLHGVKMVCANLEGACLKSCNMEDPTGLKANMEGVNLKGANLEGSQMSGVNLRVATLKNANLQNCDLRAAILAGADLENCDLSGSDLHEANLRGANLKNAAFELMLTPLHMAQAIR